MAARLEGKRIAFIATDGVEQIELTAPREAVEGAGAEVHLLAPEGGTIQGYNHLDKGDTFTVDHALADVNPERGWTRRSTWTRAWSRAASPATSRPSAPRRSRSSPRAATDGPLRP